MPLKVGCLLGKIYNLSLNNNLFECTNHIQNSWFSRTTELFILSIFIALLSTQNCDIPARFINSVHIILLVCSVSRFINSITTTRLDLIQSLKNFTALPTLIWLFRNAKAVDEHRINKKTLMNSNTPTEIRKISPASSFELISRLFTKDGMSFVLRTFETNLNWIFPANSLSLYRFGYPRRNKGSIYTSVKLKRSVLRVLESFVNKKSSTSGLGVDTQVSSTSLSWSHRDLIIN